MPYRVKDLPYEMQPRAQVRYLGVGKVPPETLLAILLRTGVPGRNVLEMAHDLLQKFGSLEALSRATWQTILAQKISGIGEVAAMVIASAFELERRAVDVQHKNVLRELHSVGDVVDLLFDGCQKLEQETLFVIPVDENNKMLTAPIAMAKGRRHGVDFDVGKIFETVLKYSSDKFLLAHNHPSGDASPSKMDVIQTRRIVEGAKIMGVCLVDHIIIGSEHSKCFSMLESGLVSFA